MLSLVVELSDQPAATVALLPLATIELIPNETW